MSNVIRFIENFKSVGYWVYLVSDINKSIKLNS